MKNLNFLLKTIFFLFLVQTNVFAWNSNQGGYIDLDLNKDFTLIYGGQGVAIRGDFVATGNTIMDGTTSATYFAHSSPTMLSEDATLSALGNSSKNQNSSSAPLSLPSYVTADHIIWAGLFWQGQIHDNANSTGAVDTDVNGWNTVRMKTPDGIIHTITSPIGNNNNEHSTYHYTHLRNGQYRFFYSAYVDVTNIVKAGGYSSVNNTFTIGNLMATDGTDGGGDIYFNHINELTGGAWFNLRMGHFGGWSLIVAYDVDAQTAQDNNVKYRNISMYNGFDLFSFWTGHAGDRFETTVNIDGFRTPSSGTISSKMLFFGGGGDYGMAFDTLQIEDGNHLGTFVNLTNNRNQGTQLFNGTYTNLNNDLIPGKSYFQGMDLDIFDTSAMMAHEQSSTNIKFGVVQQSNYIDQVFPQVIGFSTELYIPKLCYDYTLDIDGYVLDSVNNIIKTPFGGFGKPLTTVLYLKSLEGDIPLSNVDVNYTINNTSQVTYNDCTTEIAETGEYVYADACPYTHGASNAGFGIYIGTGKTASSGGIINALESRYIKFNSDLKQTDINTSFEFTVGYTVDYGSGAVPLRKTFTAADLCPSTGAGFFPQLGYFNITDSSNTHDKWNLYTQTSGRAFTLKLYAHDVNNPAQAIGNDLNLSVEVEMIRADNFTRDANTACNDEHSLLTDVPVKFVQFNQSKEVEFGYLGSEVNLAYKNTAMRVWYLTDVTGNGSLVDDHNCTRNNQNECVTLYDRDYASGGQCVNECRATLSTGNCYDCLRSYYGRKVCSRDNFAIRPESFVTQIIDSNQSEDTTQAQINIADSTTTSAEFSIVAGYDYRFDINATNHISNNATPRYRQHYSPGSPIHRVSMEWWPDGHTVSNCNDFQDQNISLNIFDGSSVNTYTNTSYVDKVDQIGKYRFSVYDQNWTSADWDDTQMVHHTFVDPLTNLNYADYYNVGDDCIYDSSIVYAEEYPTVHPKPGCKISSVHTNEDNGIVYNYLYARYYPYTFDLTGLAVGARPNNVGGDTYVYINTLDKTLYPNGVDENMSYNIQGTFSAAGYNNDTVSNFVTSCYAEDVKMILRHIYLSTIPTQEPDLRADLIDHNTTNTSLTYPTNNAVDDRRRIEFTKSLTQNVAAPLSITQTENIFVKDMKGSISMDLGYNFDRANNIALNPRRILFNDFNVTYDTQPATVYVDLKVNHKIYGQKDLDQNITFVYARAKPNKLFYDDVTSNTITTPISIVAYCDLGLIECQNRGLANVANGLLQDAQSNEASWWISERHIPASDGNVVLSASGGGTVAPSSIITTNGIDNTVTVTNTSGVTPNTVDIDFILHAAGVASYTDKWLIYNKYGNTVPLPFYKVRFIGGGNWSTTGNLPGVGHVVGDDISTKKSKRLEW